MFEQEEEAARQYDRALIVEKVRSLLCALYCACCAVLRLLHPTSIARPHQSAALPPLPRNRRQGRGAKTNFPLRQYEAEVGQYEAHLLAT